MNDFIGTYQYDKSDTFMHGKDRFQCNELEGSHQLGMNARFTPNYSNLRIRKLTPKECGRLMGVRDEDIDKMAKHQSDASLYHLFGDSIVTSVLMAIFGEMYDIDWKQKISEVLNVKQD